MVEIIHEFSQGRGWELTCQPPQEVFRAKKAVSSEVRKLIAYLLGGEVFHLVNFRSVQRGEGGTPTGSNRSTWPGPSDDPGLMPR